MCRVPCAVCRVRAWNTLRQLLLAPCVCPVPCALCPVPCVEHLRMLDGAASDA